MSEVIEIYNNVSMACEGLYGCCPGHVARVYQPFCRDCYREAIHKGKFKSREGIPYIYRWNQGTGHKWVLDVESMKYTPPDEVKA